jgi:PIN domain nuclease of toxin-antitoxin system
LDLIIDTQALVWLASDDRRLSRRVAAALAEEANTAYVSAVTAWEFADLEKRGRFPPSVRFAEICGAFDLVLLDFPSELWRIAWSLPPIHLDPVDRMLVAHAIHAGLTLVTADKTMHRYPVPILW